MGVFLASAMAWDQDQSPDPWQLRLRAVMSGSSDTDEAANYKVYSGLAIEAAICRDLGRTVTVEMALRTESREVEGPTGPSGAEALGSLELFPVSLILQWRPLGTSCAGTQPYAGAGVAASLVWEKSGLLNSIDIPSSVSPALQLGLTRPITSNTALNADVRWNMLRVDLTDLDPAAKKVRIDPLTLGLGVCLRL